MEKEYVPAKGEVEEYLKCQNLKYENKGNNQLLLTPCPFCGGGKEKKMCMQAHVILTQKQADGIVFAAVNAAQEAHLSVCRQ